MIFLGSFKSVGPGQYQIMLFDDRCMYEQL